jgi:phospholipase/carboxylesterase
LIISGIAMTVDLSFVHQFEPGSDPALPSALLLHGTGGDENDLIPLGREIAKGAGLLSPRGKALENGMPRFFRRLREGVFDEEDVRRRAGELVDFIAEARAAYGIGAPIAVGFSNGANIAAAVLLLHPEALQGAILIRAMVPLLEPPRADLAGKRVLILSGATDAIIPAENAGRLAALLAEAGAEVQHETLRTGHGLTPQDLRLAKSYFDNLRSSANR